MYRPSRYYGIPQNEYSTATTQSALDGGFGKPYFGEAGDLFLDVFKGYRSRKIIVEYVDDRWNVSDDPNVKKLSSRVS